jgi:hypothetical protein
MNLVRRKGQVVYEDLLRELELIEQRLLTEDSGAAMNLMVLEARLRERFQYLDLMLQGRMSREDQAEDAVVRTDMSALIPKDLPCYDDLPDVGAPRAVARPWETVAVAAMLAMVTACAVFGLASALQMALSWLA